MLIIWVTKWAHSPIYTKGSQLDFKSTDTQKPVILTQALHEECALAYGHILIEIKPQGQSLVKVTK